MNYINILYFICVGFHLVFCLPLGSEKSLYDAIVEKCPLVQSLSTYKDHQLFKTCKDWKTISKVDKLTETNRKEILCLLYFDSFIQYCTHSPVLNTTVSRDVLIKYNMDMICDYVKTKADKNFKSIFKTKNDCEKVCLDNMGFVDSVCSTSYYFAHAALPAVVETEGNKSPSEQILPDNGHQDEPVPSKTAEPKETLPQQKDKTDKPKTAGSVKNKPDAPLQKKMVAQDESGVNPSKDLENSDKTAIGEGIPVDSQPADQPPVDAAVLPPVANAAAKPNTNIVPGKDESHPKVDQNNANNKPNEGNPAQIENKPAETADNSKQNNADHGQAKPDSKPVKTADAIDKGENVENPALIEAPETDNQGMPQENPEQDKGEMNLQPPGSQEGDGIDDEQLSDGPDVENPEAVVKAAQNGKSSKPQKVGDSEPVTYSTEMDGDSYFFTYFMLLCIIFIVGYVCYHNKQKILALILEGRKGKRHNRGRRPNSANYHKLDSNLEEAITSSCKKNTNNVIY